MFSNNFNVLNKNLQVLHSNICKWLDVLLSLEEIKNRNGNKLSSGMFPVSYQSSLFYIFTKFSVLSNNNWQPNSDEKISVLNCL